MRRIAKIWSISLFSQMKGGERITLSPAITMAIQSVIQVAELIVIPTRPSPHDLRAVGATVDIAERHGWLRSWVPGMAR